jgi:hypothetical protein
MGTGRCPEAKGWIRAALEIAWQLADPIWAQALLAMMQKVDHTIQQSLAFSGRPEAVTLGDEAREFYSEQQAKLRGLKEYCAQADQWVGKAVGSCPPDETLSEIPQHFSAAVEIVRLLQAGKELVSDHTHEPTIAAGRILDERLAPSDQNAMTTCFITLAMIEALLKPKPTESSEA